MLKKTLGAFFLFISSPFLAIAEDMTCTNISVVRCSCPASVSVMCPDYYTQGVYLGNEQKLSSVTYVRPSKDGDGANYGICTIKNPVTDVRSLYSNEVNKETFEQMQKECPNWFWSLDKKVAPKKATYGDYLNESREERQVSLRSITLDKDAPTYSEAGDMGQPLNTLGRAEKIDGCSYALRSSYAPPLDFDIPKTQQKGVSIVTVDTSKTDCKLPNGKNYKDWKGPIKACVGYIRCSKDKNPNLVKAKLWGCSPSNDNSCPPAQQCLDDKTLSVSEAIDYKNWDSNGWSQSPILISNKTEKNFIMAGATTQGVASTGYARSPDSSAPNVYPTGTEAIADDCVMSQRAKSIQDYPSAADPKSGGSGNKVR